MREIWDDDRLRDTPWIIQAGKDILEIHAYRHDHQRRLDTSVEILAVIDANRDRWLAMADSDVTRERMAEHIDGQMMTILSGMQGAYNAGRPQLTLAALERMIAMETDDKKRENFIKQRDDRRKRMAIGLHGPEEPPERWRLP
jgi:alkanesulfonate monooxygenase SsuD/methylene tetrahydromethanopterin reductase-like flavin-dependent oxidoreductase (luciferase family)